MYLDAGSGATRGRASALIDCFITDVITTEMLLLRLEPLLLGAISLATCATASVACAAICCMAIDVLRIEPRSELRFGLETLEERRVSAAASELWSGATRRFGAVPQRARSSCLGEDGHFACARARSLLLKRPLRCATVEAVGCMRRLDTRTSSFFSAPLFRRGRLADLCALLGSTVSSSSSES